MSKAPKLKSVETFYRIREVKSGKLHNNYKGSPWSQESAVVFELNKLLSKKQVENGCVYELVTYQMKEATRSNKIDNLLSDVA